MNNSDTTPAINDYESGTSDTATAEAEHEGGRSQWAMAGAILSNVFLFFLIYGLSATVDTKSLQRHFCYNKKAIATGMGMQFLIMPFLGYVAVTVGSHYGLTEAMGITLLVLTASPGGSYSNWWCSLFNADLALSVAMTTCSSIMSVALLPFNLFVYAYLTYGKKENAQGESIIQALDFETIFISLSVVLTAILLGLYTGYRYDSPSAHARANRLGSICGLLLVISSVAMSNGGDDSKSRLWNQPASFYCAVAAPCVLGLLLSTILARTVVKLSPPESVTIAIECCYQNTGVATSVAITMFANVDERAQAVSVPFFYGVVEAVMCGFYCLYMWKRGWTKAPPNENCCTVISKNYQEVPSDELAEVNGHDNHKARTPTKENHIAEDVDVYVSHDADADDLEDVELAASLPLHPPEHAAVLQPQPQRHPTGFFSTVFSRKRPHHNSDATELALQQQEQQRKRIVSDFTAETTLTSEFQPQDSLNSNTASNSGSGGLPVQTIIEGGCESSEHVESDELGDVCDDDESQGHDNDTTKNAPLDQNESSA